MRTFTLLGLASVTAVTLLFGVWAEVPWVLSYLGGVNFTTLGLYGYDKLGARFGALRVPERTLHLFQFLGGTPFALVAQWMFRHKTIKRGFRVIFWTVAGAQCALIAWAVWHWYL